MPGGGRPRLELLLRFLMVADGRKLPSCDWLSQGWPRALLIFGGALPMVAAGPIRYLTGASAATAFVLAALLSLLLLVPFARALTRKALPLQQELLAHVALVAVVLFAGLFDDRHFYGLPSYRDANGLEAVDGAYHIVNYMDFTRRTPYVYGGFVSLYSFWDAMQRLCSRQLLVALRAGFALVRVLTAAAPCAVTFAVLYRFRRDRIAYAAGVAMCVTTTLIVQFVVILPLETVNRMSGFWPHLFGLIPTMMLWLFDALVRQRLLRVLTLFGTVVLYRYTYGLNLGDVLAALAGILVLEALGRDSPAWFRVFLALTAGAALLAARHCFVLTRRLFGDWGWIVQHDVMGACVGGVLLLVAFAIVLFFWCARREPSDDALAKALRFPFLLGVANLVFILLIRTIPPTTQYYFQKYDLHAVVVVTSALVVVASFWTAECVSRRQLVAPIGLALAIGTLGVVSIRRAFESYQEAFREQIAGGPYRRSYPWVTPAAVEMMRQVLTREHKRFGGYLSIHYPMTIFTNALFDHGDRDWLHDPKIPPTPGACVFWDGGGRFASFDAMANKQCVSYVQAPWQRLEVCAACE